MIGMDRGRKVALALVASTTLGLLVTTSAWAQVGAFLKGKTAPATPPPATTPPPGEQGEFKMVRVPANPTDSIAIVNGQAITRSQLADECVAREGKKILETLIARTLIEQAMRGRKLEVTATEVDAEIDSLAANVGHCPRDQWLRTLDKERGISPATYARDIVYPALALRKLATPMVKVTEQDIKDAFEANYGPRMRCRIIMTNEIRKANEVWEELRKHPGSFERLAKELSMDTSTRALGGMLPDLMARHAYPRNISDAAFTQLVDGDPNDPNPAHKPKDGDITGPIQVNDTSWILIKREEYVGGKSGTLADPNIRTILHDQMFDVKLQEAMNQEYQNIMLASAIENKLTGTYKAAREDEHPDFRAGADATVKRTSVAGETAPTTQPKGTRQVDPEKVSRNTPGSNTPAGVPATAATAAQQLQQTIKNAPPGTNPKPNN